MTNWDELRQTQTKSDHFIPVLAISNWFWSNSDMYGS